MYSLKTGSGRVRWLAFALLAIHPGVAVAQEAPPPPAEEEWLDRPPAPRTGDFDWVQFTNGEWLKGEVKDLQDSKFEFESDEMDTLNLDWSDIAALYMHRPGTIVFQDRSFTHGMIIVEGNRVAITTPEGETMTHDRDWIRGVIPGKGTRLSYWSGKFTLGASIRRGNVNQTDLTLFARLQRRTPGARLRMEYNGVYGEVDGIDTADNHRFTLTNDLYFTRRFYVTLPTFTAFADEFQNIDYRLTPGIALGYDIIDESKLEWTVSGGAGYEYTRFIDIPVDGSQTTETATILFGTDLEWEATKKIDISFGYDLSVPVPKTGDFSSRATLGLEFEFWKNFDFDTRIVWDHQNNPGSATQTGKLQKDDVRIEIGIGYEF